MENIDKDIVRRLSSSSALMAMLPENPGYNGSILLIDDIEAARIEKDLDDAIVEIESLRAQLSKQIPEWIPVSDRLPNDGEYVLVMSKHWDIPKVLSFRSKRIWFANESGEWYWYPERMHWMPLPPKP